MDRPGGIFSTNYRDELAIVRTRTQWVLLIGFLVLLYGFPFFASNRILNSLIMLFITIIIVHGLSILTGYTGQISLGQAAFVGVGAFTSTLLASKFGVPFLIALPLAGLASGCVGLIFGIPSLRIKGFYLAMSTLAAQFILTWIMAHLPILGGHTGLPVPPIEIAGFVFDTPQTFFILALTITIIMTITAKNIVRSRVGRAFIAIRDNDLVAELMGVDVFRYKLLSFFVCSFYAGIGGCLWAYFITQVSYDQFSLTNSIWYLGMIVVGGVGSTAGVIFGTLLFKLLDEMVVLLVPVIASAAPLFGAYFASGFTTLVYGLIIAVFLVFEPRGLAHRWQLIKTSYRLWPFSY